MKLKSLTTAVTSKVGKQLLAAKQHSPSLMFAAGVVGIGATVVLACRSTLKIEEVLDELDANLAKVDTVAEAGLSSTADQQRARVASYVKATAKLGKLYAPSLIVGGISIALLTGSHVTLQNRVAGLTAAYTALDKGFKAYRKRVVDELGEEKDREFLYGVEEREFLIEGEHGPEVVREKVVGEDGESIYGRWFSEKSSKAWSPNLDNNLLLLRAQQDYANHRLNSYGYLLLNDVYKALGMKPTSAGAVVGWLKDGEGDGFVDFGCWVDDERDAIKGAYKELVAHGRVARILLDFNVDGPMYRHIDKLEKLEKGE